MRAILGCALAVFAFNTAVAADDKKDEKIDAKQLIGKWEPKEKKEGGSFEIEFMKDGKAVFIVKRDGRETKLDGTYKLEGNKLTTTMKVDDLDRTRAMTISKLTDTEMVTADDKGKETTLVRVKAK